MFPFRLFALLIALSVGLPAPAVAQSREQKIAQVMRAVRAIDFPIFRKEVLPKQAAVEAKAALEQAGKKHELGAEWKPGNAYWDRAQLALIEDFEGVLGRRTPGDLQYEANLRESLAELSDSQLDDLLRFYDSDLFRKSIRSLDASMAAMGLAFLTQARDEANALVTLDRLKREIDRNKLTPDEEQQLDRMMRSPAMQLLARGRSAEALSALQNPSALLQPTLTQETVDRVSELIAQFRESHRIAAPPPVANAGIAAVDKAELNRRLLDAVKKVNIDQVRELLDAGADIETRDERPNQGETPLHHAARTGNVELAKLLVAKGANVNVTGPSGFTPLHVAAGLNRRAMAEYLIAAGANPNAMDAVGTPLHAATLQGYAVMVSLLLAKGANPNSRRPLDGYTPLHVFSQIGQFYASHGEIIETLVRSGADINAKGIDGHTPLDGASQEALAALIMQGALPSSGDRVKLLLRAVQSGRWQPLQYLERRGFALDVKLKGGTTLLHIAAEQEDPSAMNYLLDKGLDINAANDEGHTPLYAATLSCSKVNAELLLKKGARVNYVSPQGTTALHALLARGYRVYWEPCEQAIDSILMAGADPRIKDKEGKTPLHVIANQKRLLEKMLKAGADPRARDNNGQTPLHALGFYGKVSDAVDLLVKAGADPNAQDVKGRTPLHLFSEWGIVGERLTIARALVRNGARIDIRDHDQQTPLESYAKTSWGQHPHEWMDQPFMNLLKGEKP